MIVTKGLAVTVSLAAAGDLLMAQAFAVDQNLATIVGVLVGVVVTLWGIIWWVDGRIRLQVEASQKTIVDRLALQDKVAELNQALILKDISGLNEKLIERRRQQWAPAQTAPQQAPVPHISPHRDEE